MVTEKARFLQNKRRSFPCKSTCSKIFGWRATQNAPPSSTFLFVGLFCSNPRIILARRLKSGYKEKFTKKLEPQQCQILAFPHGWGYETVSWNRNGLVQWAGGFGVPFVLSCLNTLVNSCQQGSYSAKGQGHLSCVRHTDIVPFSPFFFYPYSAVTLQSNPPAPQTTTITTATSSSDERSEYAGSWHD